MENEDGDVPSYSLRQSLFQYRDLANQMQSLVSSSSTGNSNDNEARKSIDSIMGFLNSYNPSLPEGKGAIKSTASLNFPNIADSPYYLLDEEMFKYPEAACYHGVSRVDETLEQYEDYLKHNARRLIHKPWKVNIANLKVCMTNDVLNSINHDDFQSVQTVAAKMVDKVLFDAVNIVNNQLENDETETEIELYEVPEIEKPGNQVEFYWPQMNHFDPERMKDFIRVFVSQWSLDSGFKFFIQYLSFDKTETSEFHYYKVMISKVTTSCPNPQATASVFFTVEVTPVVAETIPVRVTYQFEHLNQVHVPDGRKKFQKFIINNIIKNKLQIFSELDF